ncbi:MAG: ATP-binding protein [Candidatus Omnitrophota bacterium]
MKITIGRRLIIGFFVILLLMIALAIYSLNTSRNFLLNSVGENSVFLAEDMMNAVEHNVNDKIEFLHLRSKGFLVREVLSASNQEFESLENIQEYIDQKDREWVFAPKGSLTPFMKEIIGNRLSQQMREEYIKFWLDKYGYPAFQEAFVTNRYGANVAQTGRTTDYRQDDEAWWQDAKRDGAYVSDIEYDESSGVHGIVFAHRVEGDDGSFMGVIKAVMPVTGIIKEIELTLKRYETTEVKLVTKRGELIYATKPFRVLEDISGKDFFKQIKRQSGFFMADEGRRKKVFSYVRSKDQRRVRTPQWIILVSHDTAEIFSPVFILRNHILSASVTLVILTVLVAFFLSRSITKPITKLHKGTEVIGAGNLDYKVGTQALDEIGELSRAFDQMTENLKKITASRDELNREIAERKRAEEELKSTYEELKRTHRQLEESEAQLIQSEKMRTLGMVTAGIAHELNNPMMGMLNFVQYCIKHTPENDSRYGILQDIEHETRRCISIVQNLLTFSHMSREGEQEYQKESLSVVLDRTLQLLSYRIDIQHVGIIKHIPEDMPRIRMKVSNIQQMFLNLITNSLDALEKAEKKEIHIEVRPEGEYVHVTVADTGSGVAPKNLNRIFNPFFTTRPPGKGTGLGLSICQSIVEEHGGSIICESQPGAGTTFKITLPIEKREEGRGNERKANFGH